MSANKNVVITGSNRGIGKACVEAFVRKGMNVWACARTVDMEYEQWLAEISARHGVWAKPVYFALDDLASIDEGLKTIFADKEPIDILVNNAAITNVNLLLSTSIDEIKKVFDVNFFSQLYLVQKVAKRMIRNKSGCIISMASAQAFEPDPGQLAYGASKAAMMFATKALAKELSPFHIRVNALAPGPVETGMLKQYPNDEGLVHHINGGLMKRLGKPEEIANVITFLASDEASFINGQVIRVDGGRPA